MNGGAYGREVSDILVSARLVLRSGEAVEWPLEKLGYTYRHSALPDGAVVVEAVFRGAAGDPQAIGWGYAAGAALMLFAAAAELWLGVVAERRALEDVARPLSCVDDDSPITT